MPTRNVQEAPEVETLHHALGTNINSKWSPLWRGLHCSKYVIINTRWQSLTCCELPNVRRSKVMSRTSTRYKTCIKISSKLFNFLFYKEVVRIQCGGLLIIQTWQ